MSVATSAEIVEMDALRRRNAELEREVREGREREAAARRELERRTARLRAVEDAEERLAAELGEIEAEAVEQAREYLARIRELSDRLDAARRILAAAGIGHALPSAHNI